MLQPNQPAPVAISLTDDTGTTVSLQGLLGSYVVIYFYPQDDTPGCTIEACAFRDRNQDLLAKGVKVIGVSKDSVKSHQEFKAKHTLPFPLWADENHELAAAFGVWQEKKFMGKTYMGIDRATFIIDPNGTIIKTWSNVNPLTHTQEVIAFLSEYVQQ